MNWTGGQFLRIAPLKVSGHSRVLEGRTFHREAASQKKKCWFALRFLSRVNPLCGLSYSKLTGGNKVRPEYCDSIKKGSELIWNILILQ